MKILITGIGGSGKTTVVDTLAERGDVGVDLDRTGLCYWENKETGEKDAYVAGVGKAWIENHSWRCDIPALTNYLASFPPKQDIHIGGKIASSQFAEVAPLFDKVFLLRPSDDVLAHRQTTRTNKANGFAKSPEEQKHLRVARVKFEKVCLDNGAILIDADKSIDEILNEIQG